MMDIINKAVSRNPLTRNLNDQQQLIIELVVIFVPIINILYYFMMCINILLTIIKE